MNKEVLDPCCGSRMFYFDKSSPDVLFCDCRQEEKTLIDGRELKIIPDQIIDVCKLPFEDESFSLVVFDPPHLKQKSRGYQVGRYGYLPKDWQSFMTKAFSECWRVLKANGTLIFKWNEYAVPLKDVLKCAPAKPLFGNRRPKLSKTYWIVFFKGAS